MYIFSVRWQYKLDYVQGAEFYFIFAEAVASEIYLDREFFQFHTQQLGHCYKDPIWISFVCYIVNMQMKEKKERQNKCKKALHAKALSGWPLFLEDKLF